MMHRFCWTALLACALCGRAEIIDRVAVTVDRIVITESDILNQMRIAAFLNSEPINSSTSAKREAASRLVEQVLIRREMEISRYPAPELLSAENTLAEIKKDLFPGGEGYLQALAQYGIVEQELLENILLQLTTLQFIDYRFRPGIAIADEEVQAYFEQKLKPEHEKRIPDTPLVLEDVRDQIEEILIEERVDQALDRWLRQASGQASIRYREEVFR